MIYFAIYIQNTLSQPIKMARSHSKSPTGVYIHLLKIDLFLNPNYHALCTSVSFIFAVFSLYATASGYAPNFSSKQQLCYF